MHHQLTKCYVLVTVICLAKGLFAQPC
uniref:Uncharacterized protein n=1 Tax=Arundo donax TaxID=35708 RepID=A0A0A9BW83_ARUDO